MNDPRPAPHTSPAGEPLDLWVRDHGPAAQRWTLVLYPTGVRIEHGNVTLVLTGVDARRRLRLRTRTFRGPLLDVLDERGETTRRLRGMRRREGHRLGRALNTLEQRQHAAGALDALTSWHSSVETTLADARRDLRWISSETVHALVAARPPVDALVQHLMVPPLWNTLRPTERDAVRATGSEVAARVAAANEEIVTAALVEHRDFFATIESSPLTREQARAVLTFDNRVHVVAAAGSGKTSVMVGRAAYATQRGFVDPHNILLLAFNKAAADELAARVHARFTAAGIDASGVRATTFHAFGLDVIGRATGRRPSVAPWVTDGRDIQMVSDLVAELRERDPKFAFSWDLFRLLYARVTDDWTAEPVPDGWDKSTRTAGLRTFAGDVVRSQGERLLADWLYLNHVRYEYERPYVHDTVTADRRQYVPDFYYPDIDTWHEHWGIDAHGQPPPSQPGYLESMRWKQQLHRRHGTDLLETTWAGVMAGTDLRKLAADLDARGIIRRWDPHRPTVGASPVKDSDLIQLVRTFMTHVKSNSLTRANVSARLAAGRVNNAERARLFLDVYWPLHDAWQSRLDAGGFVDFEDMLVNAAAHVESGRYVSDYELVLVDEFQDASQARARLTRALVNRPGRYLLAVGDDWQSVNRFAGADLSVLTRFHHYFGPGPSVHLTTTFRCHQSIADAAAAFVAKNPSQLTKAVTSVHTGPTQAASYEGVTLRYVPSADAISTGIADVLADLDAAVAAGTIVKRAGEPVTVDVLGRYRHDASLVPARRYRHLLVRFRTVHAAKGLEADYVVVANLTAGTYGFPSEIADDPVLNLAMVDADGYEHAEERRLFYVALTRARRGAVLLAPADAPSPFVPELVADGTVAAPAGADAEDTPTVCPACGRGVLRRRESRYGQFWGCSTFPSCQHTTADERP